MKLQENISRIKQVMGFLNEETNQFTEEIIAYHRSPKMFHKFNISNISANSNRQRYGYGLYFSDNIPNKQYGDYLYKVKLFNNKKEYFLLDTNEPVEEHIVNKIIEALNEYNKKSDEIVEFSYSGFLFYKTLSRILGSDKKASTFLFNNGIDGLKSSISKNWNDYILFNDDSITIEEIKYEKQTAGQSLIRIAETLEDAEAGIYIQNFGFRKSFKSPSSN